MTPSVTSAEGSAQAWLSRPMCLNVSVPLVRADADQRIQVLFAERRVRPQRDHEIELARILQDFHHGAEQERQGQRAGVVGDQRQHVLAFKSTRQPLFERLADGSFGEQACHGNCLGSNHILILHFLEL